MAQSACADKDPDLFFPAKGENKPREAFKICQGCPVTEECLEYAIKTGCDFGVWGGVLINRRNRKKIAELVAKAG